MGLAMLCNDGETPLDEEEKEGLRLSSIGTRAELDEFEQLNVEKAIQWTLSKKFTTEKILTEGFVRLLHQKMFADVWGWAGKFRTTEKNLGIKHSAIGTSLRQLNDDCLFWIENNVYLGQEIAIRYKHRLVSIHCFSNGNGRHSRLMADIIISHIFNQQVFSWGRTTLSKESDERRLYLNAIRKADKGEFAHLIQFAQA